MASCNRSLILIAALAGWILPGHRPLLAQTADPGRPGQAGPVATEDAAGLSPGDAIRVVFWREPELTGDFPVDEKGEAVLPILGPFAVGDLGLSALKARLAAAYDAQLRNQDVQITLLRRVRVVGAVTEPGLYFVDPTMTIGDALALAGGASDRGRLDGIRALRGDRLIRDDLGPDDLFDEDLYRADRVHVPERSWLSRHSTVLLGGAISATAILLTRVLIR